MKRIFFLLFWGGGALLQAQELHLETISIEQGLSQGFVPSICQDEDGFLWFATKNGLNRYDGYQFHVFKNDPFDSLSLSNNELIAIAAVGDFLVLTNNNLVIQLFHRKTQRFYTLWPMDKFGILYKILAMGENEVAFLHLEGKEVSLSRAYWPEDLSQSLEKGTPVKDLIKLERLEKYTDLIDAEVSADGKKIWIYTKTAMLIRDLQTGKTQQWDVPVFNPLPVYHALPFRKRMAVDIAGATWIFQKTRAACFDGRKWRIYTLPFSNGEFFFADRENKYLWFLSGNTLHGLDVSKLPSPPQPTWQLKFDQPLICAYTDRYDNVWLGTDAHGIRKFSLRTGAFRNYLKGFSIYCQPVFDEKKYVLMGDVRRNQFTLKLLDLERGEEAPIELLGLPGTDMSQSVTAENGRFWMTDTHRPEQLTCLDLEKGSRESIPLPPNDKKRYPMLRFAAPGEIWLIAANQMTRFDIASRRFSVFDNPLQPTYAETYAAECSPDGTWWMGTSDALYKAEPVTNASGEAFRFSKITAEKGNRNSLLTHSIKSLLIDPDDANILWIGTNGQGMSRLDIGKNQFTHYTTQNGLPDDVVYGILADDEKPRNLWISTNRGLARFNTATKLFQYFFKSDGLQDNEFNTFASYKSRSGKLFFGGVNGLTVFDPKDLSSETAPPKIHLTGLKINGVDVNPHKDEVVRIDKDIAFLERLELPFSKNNLVLQFAATDYTAPQRNQFAYYLEGAEPEWAHRGFEHSAQYLNLAPGTYTFRVKAANSSGVWNEQPIALFIVIHAPWYRTGWAYLAYVVLLAASVFFLYKNQLRRRLEHAEAERLKGLDEFKSRFFTNITHEFRTPLTVILGTSEQVEVKVGDDLKSKMKLIRRNGENLLRLINQILDLAKLESRTLKMNYVQGDVLAYLRYIAESMHSVANAQNVMLRVESDQARIVMDYDPERLLQIVHNLISNAIKFTPSGGRVNVKAGLLNLENLDLRVTDTGAGIPPSDLPHIFDRFYQASNLEKAKAGGTGIGLALTRELIQAMNGEISVESTVGKGTMFKVKLPITQKAPLLTDRVASGHPLTIPASQPDSDQIPKSSKLVSREERHTQILLIEDNPDVIEYLAACLNDQYTLDFAYNGRAGIEKALETVPDLIVSDVMMPEKDGLEVCDFLKNDERTSHIPIILLTAKADIASRIAGLKRGADAYLSKPFHQEELLVTLTNLLELRKKLQARYQNWQPSGNTGLPVMEPERSLRSSFLPDLEDAFLQKVKTAIQERLSDSSLTVDDLCRALAMSQPQLHRKLTALTGKNATLFIRFIRLAKAKELLLLKEKNVSEVAFEVGFDDPKYFSRVFAEEFGVAPSKI